ncbi:MAG: dehydrogenase [Acidimicrobiaceae bacterium]|nr:dehydrogenase [Acidimicrobiaceae bacterium]MCS5675359.1 acyl-CoA dehydrogenase family protein [Acidimicrobiales bacterium]MEE2806336.1 acyl-CoA dehydrogenase family protein [Actinomycetota bacterium]|tara:strand:+ start:7343 stop:8539 length:1197 start_codon:yes stop_codon:yes gene_type:complete
MSDLTEEQIRSELGAILERRSADTRLTTMGAGSDDLDDGRHYLATTVEGGWHVPTWPQQYGGRGASPSQNALIGRLLREFVVPDLYPFAIGLGMVGPALLAHGTQEQQQEWLRPIASGTSIWCQMFSEPEAGSDLANVALKADQDGEEWVLTGQKTWTSRAMWADWAICLARTDPGQPKHKGLTMFSVPIDTPGVEVRPLTQMNRDAHFSEVFVEDARVLDAWRIGARGEGWRVAMTVLAHERAGGGSRGGGDGNARGVRIPGWISDLQGLGGSEGRVWREEVSNIYAHDSVSRWTSQRAADEARASGIPGPAGSGAKLRTVKSYKDRAYLANRSGGSYGMLSDGHGYIETMTAPSMSIRGGTDEIQRNILGERVLGLPGEPRVDRDVPWNESRRGLL